MKPKRERKPQHPEYGRGYRRGLKTGLQRSDNVIDALRGQVDYWRGLYMQLRDKSPAEAKAAALVSQEQEPQ